MREQKRRLQGHGREAATLALRRSDFHLGVLVKKPTRILAENAGEHLEHFRRRHALSRLHHAEIGHGRGTRGVDLDASRRELIQGEAVALAQGPQLRTQKMALPDQSCHQYSCTGALSAQLCEIHTVKFLMCKSSVCAL